VKTLFVRPYIFLNIRDVGVNDTKFTHGGPSSPLGTNFIPEGKLLSLKTVPNKNDYAEKELTK
jgi:hypothetical protein